MNELTRERLKELLHYDAARGQFTRKTARPGVRAGAVVGCVDRSNGYVRVRVDGRSYLAHRLAVLWVTGSAASHEVDHINGRRSDNSWGNLRAATRFCNAHNQKRAQRSNKSSGLLGVSSSRRKALPWAAAIKVNGQSQHIGHFATAEQAHAAYLAAKAIAHPGAVFSTADDYRSIYRGLSALAQSSAPAARELLGRFRR